MLGSGHVIPCKLRQALAINMQHSFQAINQNAFMYGKQEKKKMAANML